MNSRSPMRTVEIAYQSLGEASAAARARPDDCRGARRRIDDGNRSFANLLRVDAEASGTGARRVIPISPARPGPV